MNIKILWTGCKNCVTLENNTKLALEKAWIEAQIEKITDITDIMSYPINSTPGLVIDEKVVSAWKVLDVNDIITLLKWNTQNQETPKKSCCCSCNWKC